LRLARSVKSRAMTQSNLSDYSRTGGSIGTMIPQSASKRFALARQLEGQQPSETAEQVVTGSCAQRAVHLVGSPSNTALVQASASLLHWVGQLEGGSQVSPVSRMPLPQTAAQSESVAAPHAEGQQPSPGAQAVMFVNAHTRVQSSLLPETTSWVQALLSLQVAGHAPGLPAVIARSHFSGDSTTRLPHTGAQSLSLLALQPTGQQPSPPVQVLVCRSAHSAVQSAEEPCSSKREHPSAMGHAVGQAPGIPAAMALSHRSVPPSYTAFPHEGSQSPSLFAFPPGGQHLSPSVNEVVDSNTQRALHVPADSKVSRVQGSLSLQATEQRSPAGVCAPVSQVSLLSFTLSPQVAEQSESVTDVQPVGQQASLVLHV